MTMTKQVSLHGKRACLTKDDILVGRGGIAAGGDDKPTIVLPGAPDTVAVFEDFLTDMSGTAALDTGAAGQFFLARCTDTGVKGALVAGTNGVFRITSSETITTATPAN